MTVRPQHVMRFYGNLEYAIQSIRCNEITFLHPDKLNDPFDPPFSFTTDFNEDYQALIKYGQQHHAETLQNFKQSLPENNWKTFVEKIEHFFNCLRSSTFLFSTSAVNKDKHPKDNLCMWSHYGKGHRGIAIEFNTDLLAKSVLEKNKRLNGQDMDIDEVWCEINYTPKLPKITCQSVFQYVINVTEYFDNKA